MRKGGREGFGQSRRRKADPGREGVILSAEDYKKYFEVLELDTNASLADVKRVYLHLKSLYSTESIVTSPILDEFSDDNRHAILEQIEEAHTRLTEYFERQAVEEGKGEVSQQAANASDADLEGITHFTGEILRRFREKMGIELQDIALATKIRTRYLEAIEEESFGSLPPDVYTRGFVTDYARYLRLDPERVAHDYMGRYRAWKEKG